jgi:proteasome assembly chaperone (PAC2) family protein
MKLKIKRDIAGELCQPVLLAGWPGMGNVGLGAIDYLRRQLDATPFAEVDMREYYTPEAVEVQDGIAKFPELPSHLFYYVKEPSLLIFESEVQIPGSGGTSLMSQILDIAEQHGAKTVYTGAAFAMPVSHKEEAQVLGVANQESLRDALVPHGVQLLNQGQISGMNGLLLGFAGARDMQAACLLATMPQYAINMPNPKASREIVRTLERVLGVEVDKGELDDLVDQMSETLGQIEGKIQTAFTSMVKEERQEAEVEEVDEERVPQYVMEKIEQLFREVKIGRSKDTASELKKELDRWGLYNLYEDRFLSLFRQE